MNKSIRGINKNRKRLDTKIFYCKYRNGRIIYFQRLRNRNGILENIIVFDKSKESE